MGQTFTKLVVELATVSFLSLILFKRFNLPFKGLHYPWCFDPAWHIPSSLSSGERMLVKLAITS